MTTNDSAAHNRTPIAPIRRSSLAVKMRDAADAGFKSKA
jgi:hypothetical protein